VAASNRAATAEPFTARTAPAPPTAPVSACSGLVGLATRRRSIPGQTAARFVGRTLARARKLPPRVQSFERFRSLTSMGMRDPTRKCDSLACRRIGPIVGVGAGNPDKIRRLGLTGLGHQHRRHSVTPEGSTRPSGTGSCCFQCSFSLSTLPKVLAPFSVPNRMASFALCSDNCVSVGYATAMTQSHQPSPFRSIAVASAPTVSACMVSLVLGAGRPAPLHATGGFNIKSDSSGVAAAVFCSAASKMIERALLASACNGLASMPRRRHWTQEKNAAHSAGRRLARSRKLPHRDRSVESLRPQGQTDSTELWRHEP